MDESTYKAEITRLDREILKLFRERMAVSAAYVGENAMSRRDRAFERQCLAEAGAGDPETGIYARLLDANMIEYARAYQSERALPLPDDLPRETRSVFPRAATVACQGVEGAYSQAAADKVFPFADITYVPRFDGVFRAVESGLCRFGVLPVENSSHGSVIQNYDLMRRHRFSIARAVKLHISHNLMALPGANLSDIRTIISHEQAIGQCSEFLSTLKDVQVKVCENTAMAAKLVSNGGDRTVAAISQESCAELYGLSILKTRIQNTDNNYTRFIIIEKNQVVYPGSSKISVLFSTPHMPGALERVMARFSCLGLNLTKLESRPEAGSDFHYVFYVDLEASIEDEDVRRLLLYMKRDLPMCTLLGAYQEV